MSDIELHVNEIELEDLYSIHKICDHDFDPPLSSRTNIRFYCEKLFKNAERISIDFKGKLAGVLCIYMNDSLNRIAFISSVAILADYRRSGLGNLLIGNAISLSKEKQMSKIRLEVGRKNPAALNLYRKHGFEIEKENDLTLLMSRELNGK
jgi:ribosomal protein S18 acetylase RimI-like enzyme